MARVGVLCCVLSSNLRRNNDWVLVRRREPNLVPGESQGRASPGRPYPAIWAAEPIQWAANICLDSGAAVSTLLDCGLSGDR
jgi:hypothetical protein